MADNSDKESSVNLEPENFANDDDDSVTEEDSKCCYVNPTGDALHEGILGLIRPAVETIDHRVCQTRKAQEELKNHITELCKDLEEIKALEDNAKDQQIEEGISKLNNSKKRIVVIENVLIGVQERMNRIQKNSLEETIKNRNLLETSD